MQKVSQIGQIGVYCFKDSKGKSVIKYDTVENHDNHFFPKKGEQTQPSPLKYGLSEEYKFFSANRAAEFDTKSGELEDGQYAIFDNRILYNVGGECRFIKKSVLLFLKEIDDKDLKE